jgi:hypothetical protein
MPSVLIIPVYVEVPSGFERAISALESHLERAGYAFHTGEPLSEDLERMKARLGSAAKNRDEDEHSREATDTSSFRNP